MLAKSFPSRRSSASLSKTLRCRADFLVDTNGNSRDTSSGSFSKHCGSQAWYEVVRFSSLPTLLLCAAHVGHLYLHTDRTVNKRRGAGRERGGYRRKVCWTRRLKHQFSAALAEVHPSKQRRNQRTPEIALRSSLAVAINTKTRAYKYFQCIQPLTSPSTGLLPDKIVAPSDPSYTAHTTT